MAVTPPRKYQVDQLNRQVSIVNEDGTPKPELIQQWNLLLALVQQVATLSGINIDTTAPILGGGLLEDFTPISHATSGATPGTYGDATNVAQVTVDATGHVTAVTEVAISGGSGAEWTLVDSHDFAATPQATFDVDVTGYADILVIWRGVTAAASGFRGLRLSIDGGSTFYAASGNYVFMNAGGAATNSDGLSFMDTPSAAARTGQLLLSAAGTNGIPKPATGSTIPQQFVASTAPVTDVRVYTSGAGNMTGGVVYVLAR